MNKDQMHLSVLLALVTGTVLLIALGRLPESHWATVLALFVPSVLGRKDPDPPGAGPYRTAGTISEAEQPKPPILPRAILAAGVCCYAIGALLAQACTPPATPAAAEAAYTAEQLACVHEAGTREESRACRAEVDRRWGVADAGKD